MKRDRIGAALRFGLAVLGLLLLGAVSGEGEIPALGGFLLLLPPVSLAANLLVRKKLHAEICLPTTAAKGAAVMGTVLIKNKALLPAAKLYCRLRLVNDLTGEEQRQEIICGAGPGREQRREFLLESAVCGRIYVHIESLMLMDYCGLFALKVPVKAAARITVLPELFHCDVTVCSLAALSDDSAAPQRGDDPTEVFQLREYRSGDDIRRIHWKLSSKLESLLLREPGRSISHSLLVLWDKRESCAPERMDAMAEVAASVCQAICDSGTPFDLCWTEKDEAELRQIRDEDALLQTLPALVTQAGTRECSLPDWEEYGRVLYIAAQPCERQSGKVTCLLCTDAETETGGCIAFSAADYRERLERLEI